jgi:hypothetical protein
VQSDFEVIRCRRLRQIGRVSHFVSSSNFANAAHGSALGGWAGSVGCVNVTGGALGADCGGGAADCVGAAGVAMERRVLSAVMLNANMRAWFI